MSNNRITESAAPSHGPFFRGTAWLLLATLAGCTTMRPVNGPPKEFITVHEPSVVWVTRAEPATPIALEAPRVLGDTIVGFVEGEYTELPVTQIRTVQAKQFSRGRTTAFLVGMGVLAAGLTFVLAGGHGTAAEMLEEEDIGVRLFRVGR